MIRYDANTQKIIDSGQGLLYDWERQPECFAKVEIGQQQLRQAVEKTIAVSSGLHAARLGRDSEVEKLRSQRDQAIEKIRRDFAARSQKLQERVQKAVTDQKAALDELSRLSKVVRYQVKANILNDGDRNNDHLEKNF